MDPSYSARSSGAPPVPPPPPPKRSAGSDGARSSGSRAPFCAPSGPGAGRGGGSPAPPPPPLGTTSGVGTSRSIGAGAAPVNSGAADGSFPDSTAPISGPISAPGCTLASTSASTSASASGSAPEPALPPAGWVPTPLAPTSASSPTTEALRLALAHPTLLKTLPDHPSERGCGPGIVTHNRDAVRSQLRHTVALADRVRELEGRVRDRRGRVQEQLVEAKVLERQFGTEQGRRDGQLEVFGPRMVFRKVCAAVEEADRVVERVERAFLDGDGGGAGGGAGAGGDGDESGEGEGGGGGPDSGTARIGQGRTGRDGPALASDREVAEFVRSFRAAKKVAFLRRQRKERWEEGRVGGWRY